MNHIFDLSMDWYNDIKKMFLVFCFVMLWVSYDVLLPLLCRFTQHTKSTIKWEKQLPSKLVGVVNREQRSVRRSRMGISTELSQGENRIPLGTDALRLETRLILCRIYFQHWCNDTMWKLILYFNVFVSILWSFVGLFTIIHYTRPA